MLSSLTAPFRNPIFEREFIEMCRTKRWFVLRTLLVTFLTVATWVVLSTTAMDEDNLDQTGMILFLASVSIQIGFVFFLASGLCSDLIVSERRKETLDIILTTPLRPLSIVLGKFLARIGILVVMVVASFPLVSVSLLFGGVSGRQIVGLFEVTLGTIFLTAGPALLVSVYARRLGTAAILAQMFPIAWCLASPLVIWLVTQDGDVTAELLVLTHPIMAAMELGETFPYIKRAYGIHPSTGYLLFGALVTAACVTLSVLRLRRERTGQSIRGGPAPTKVEPRPSDRESIRKRIHDIRNPAAPQETRPPTPPARRPRRSRLRIGSLRNPLLWKEINLINASTSRALFWIVAILLVGAEVLYFVAIEATVIDAWEVHVVMASCVAFVLLLLTVVNAATSIVSERAQATLELLHVTPITVRQILNAKAAGVIRSVAFLSIIPILHMAGAAAFTELSFAGFFAFLLTYSLMVLYFTTVGLRHSIVADRPPRAIFRALVHFAVLMIGYPMLVGLFGALGMLSHELGGMLFVQPAVLIGGSVFIVQADAGGAEEVIPWIIIAFTLYGVITLVRTRTMAQLYRERILGRVKPTSMAGRVQ